MVSSEKTRIEMAAELIKTFEFGLQRDDSSRIDKLRLGLVAGLFTAEKKFDYTDDEVDKAIASAVCMVAMRRLGRTGVTFTDPADFAKAFVIAQEIVIKILERARDTFDQPLG